MGASGPRYPQLHEWILFSCVTTITLIEEKGEDRGIKNIA